MRLVARFLLQHHGAARDAILDPSRDVSFFAASIRQAMALGSLARARDCHSEILHSRHSGNTFLGNLLVTMYARCGSVEEARAVFDRIGSPNTFSWNAIVSAYAQDRQLDRARELFDRMPDRDAVSWNLMLRAYAQHGDLAAAKFVFDRMSPRSVISWTAILAAFSQSGHIAEAEAIFHRTPQHDTVAGNAMITAYAQHGHMRDAFWVFESMPLKDALSWNLILQGLAVNSSPDEAAEFFAAMPSRNVVSWNAMLAAFAQRGRLPEARRAFDRMPQLELASWNTMITALANTGHLSRGRELFEAMPESDIISWNTLIVAYAETASRTSTELFQQLNLEGLKPTHSTFVGLLVGCNRGGKVKIAHHHFVEMSASFGLMPELDHYGCMVEVLGRAKELEQAEELIHAMPYFPGPVTWTGYLSSCRIHGDYKRAAAAAESLMELDPANKTMYQLLANMYSDKAAAQQRQQRRWQEADAIGLVDGGEEVAQESNNASNLETIGTG